MTIRQVKDTSELAEELFSLKSDFAGNNADFAACLIACATTVADYDGISPADIRRIFTTNIEASLQVCAERRIRRQASGS